LAYKVRPTAVPSYCISRSDFERMVNAFELSAKNEHPLAHVVILEAGAHCFVCSNFIIELRHHIHHRCQKHTTRRLTTKSPFVSFRWYSDRIGCRPVIRTVVILKMTYSDTQSD
jgi:hypothetical protein